MSIGQELDLVSHDCIASRFHGVEMFRLVHRRGELVATRLHDRETWEATTEALERVSFQSGALMYLWWRGGS